LLQDQGRYFNPRNHSEDDQRLPPVKPDSGYYATVANADHAIGCLKEHAAEHADKPFFHYLAFSAPHFPLHALPDDIARYRDQYRTGWEAARQARYQRQQAAKLLGCKLSPVESDVGPPYHFPEALKTLGDGEVNRPLPWDKLTDQQRDFQATKMAIHAAMVDRMDQEIGRVLQQVRDMGAWENTVIFFLSDNGASAEIMVRDDGHNPAAPAGSAATYLCLGPGWSTVANTPFRRHKTWVHEGGISTPLVVHWPRGIASRGALRNTPGHVVDLAPTILELAGVQSPQPAAGAPPYAGRSLLPALASDVAIERELLWWAHEGHRAVRVGDWKLVAAKDTPWELYQLAQDRSETLNLAAKHPDQVRRLEEMWLRQFENARRWAAAE
jgi:arylsulfatase